MYVIFNIYNVIDIINIRTENYCNSLKYNLIELKRQKENVE